MHGTDHGLNTKKIIFALSYFSYVQHFIKPFLFSVEVPVEQLKILLQILTLKIVVIFKIKAQFSFKS